MMILFILKDIMELHEENMRKSHMEMGDDVTAMRTTLCPDLRPRVAEGQ